MYTSVYKHNKHRRDEIGKEAASLQQMMEQGAWVQTPPTTVLGHNMAGDVKSALNLFQLGIRLQGK